MSTNEHYPDNMAEPTCPLNARSHVRDLSSAPWPPQVGEVVILMTEPTDKTRGYVGIVNSITTTVAEVRLLDSTLSMKLPVDNLIATGKTGHDLINSYLMTDLELSHAVETERSFPDFDRQPNGPHTRQPKAKSKPKSLNQALKGLTKDQTEALARLVLQKLKEAQNNDTNDAKEIHNQMARPSSGVDAEQSA